MEKDEFQRVLIHLRFLKSGLGISQGKLTRFCLGLELASTKPRPICLGSKILCELVPSHDSTLKTLPFNLPRLGKNTQKSTQGAQIFKNLVMVETFFSYNMNKHPHSINLNQ